MSQTPDVPIPPGLAHRYGHSAAGRAWLATLPGLIEQLRTEWQLELDLEPGTMPWHGQGSLVVPVRRGGKAGEAAVLKIAYPHDEAVAERHALGLWGGHGAVGLLAADAVSGALLLERLDPTHSLQDVPLEAAVPVWGGLLRRLSLVPDGRPGWREFEHVAARAEQWSDDLPAEWEQLGRPFPRWLLEAALEVCQTRGAVGRRAGKDVLVHTELHYRNVLARPGAPSRPEAQDFAAIDPQPMIGEPEFAVAPLLWNRLSDLPVNGAEAGLRRRCTDFSSAAGLDPDVARQWAIAREVANALVYAGKPDHRGDLARSLWVASTLAGKTLDGLPSAHRLPEPGEAVGAR
jgi:streptomycin 6-kinase